MPSSVQPDSIPLVNHAPKDALKAGIEEHSVALSTGRMRYLKAGSGPAIILVHGLMGYSFSWRFTMSALAPYATVYAIDNLGSGLSPAPSDLDCTVRGTAQRVLEFAAALGLSSFDLLGTSHGGAVTMLAAAICADRKSVMSNAQPTPNNPSESDINRLILVAPVNPWSPHGRRLAPFLTSPLGAFVFRNTIERFRALDYLWLRRLFADGEKIPPDSLAGYRLPILHNGGFDHASQILKTWLADLADLESSLPKIRDYPTLLMWGTRDRAVSFSSAEPLRRSFQKAQLVAFEGVGHLPYEEAPQQFNAALIGFLQSAPEK